jgi:hypothetical protein
MRIGEKMAARTTVADLFKLVAGKFSIFSTAITEVTGVNNILEELIANELALRRTPYTRL